MKNHENHDQHEGQESAIVRHNSGPYWKRAHHDWRFWVGVVLMLVAMTIYVGTNNLSSVPSGQLGKVKTAHLMPH